MADNNLTEQLLLPEKLTIEHALPQTWHETWVPKATPGRNQPKRPSAVRPTNTCSAISRS